MKIEGSASGSGSISQRHGSPNQDPHQNVMDPQHWRKEINTLSIEPLAVQYSFHTSIAKNENANFYSWSTTITMIDKGKNNNVFFKLKFMHVLYICDQH
jgi:hypothetical protein